MKEKTKKLIALIMAAVMLIGSGMTVGAAKADTSEKDDLKDIIDSNETLQSMTESMNLITYEAYKSKYGYIEDKDKTDADWGDLELTVDGADYDAENTDAAVEVKKVGGVDAVVTPAEGTVAWRFDVPEAGWYTVTFEYSAVDESKADIERLFRLNGLIPYSEARYISMQRTWEYEYAGETREDAFEVDAIGNELAPEMHTVATWETYSMKDFYGHYTKPLEFYMNEGENVVSLQGVREAVAISTVKVHSVEKARSYKDILAEYEKKGYKPAEGEAYFMEAEMPDTASSVMIYPIYDLSSAITSPQHTTLIKRNTIGGDKWTSPGKWIRYEFTCEATGLYDIVTRYRQDAVNGMYTSRSIKINGEYPFEEAKNLRFDYSTDWQVGSLTDGYDTFQFYFEKGETYVIELEVTLGNMAEIIRRVDQIIDNLNDDYMSILKLTGNDPDVNRDYGLSRIMPDVIVNLGGQAIALESAVDYISEMNGIKSDNTATLEQAAVLVERMATDEAEIAANLGSLKEWISSLGTWMTNVSSQYVELDYIMIQPAGSELPEANASSWQSFLYEMQKFFASFYADYNSIGTEESGAGALSVWTSSGRDQAQIIKNLINEGFAKETGASVELKLTAGGVLLQSILAGVGPDVSIDSQSPMDMAIRGAIVPLNKFDTFDEVMSRFSDSAKVPITLYGETYAVPTGQVPYFMFCRNDILSQLGLSVPETWDDLMSMVPVLQFNNMEIGMAQDFSLFLYQQGGSYWRDEGMANNFDSTLALDCFEYMCNMFTQYSLPVNFDGSNRFKTGEMPVLISGLDLYNTLQIFAPEISGLWGFYEIPGTLNEETGEVDHSCISFISGVVMPRGCNDEELAWDFLDWYSDKDYQVDYANEMVALLGPSGKSALSNIEAMDELTWTESEYKTLQKVFADTFAIEYYPGDYFVTRYVGFAFNSATTQGADPSDELLSYVSDINKEITRKRKEFDLMIDSEWSAIKAYTGFETTTEWREYWASEQGTDASDNTAIRDIEDADYTYVDWMEEHNVSVDSFEKWQKETNNGTTTLSYKEWTEQ